MHDLQQAPTPGAARAATWRRYLRFWGPRAEADVDDELAFHIEMRARDYVERGMSPDEARRAAMVRLGDVAGARAECIAITSRRERRMTRAQLVDAFVHDVRFAIRTLGRQKAWTAVAVITLALGIGANTAVFSVVNTLLLHPLPYPGSNRMAFVFLEPARGNTTGISVSITPPGSLAMLWREQSRAFEALEVFTSGDRAMRITGGPPVSVAAGSVLPSFAAFTGATPVVGRGFVEADIADGGRVALLSEGFWKGRFGGDRAIVGKSITLDNEPYTVIGVMPDRYRLPRLGDPPSDVWLPLDVREDPVGLSLIGRLRPGVSLAVATQELDSLYARSPNRSSEKAQLRARLASPGDLVNFRQSLLLLSGAVALVLLIACGNVAHLLLAHTAARQREFAIRAALGAGRMRLVRQLVTESIILAAAGCIGGVLVGWVGLRALVAMRPDSLSELGGAVIDGTTLAVTAALAAATGLLVGALGTLQSLRLSAHEALKAGAASVSQSRRQRRLRSLLVVSEMALSTVLLVGAALLVRSIMRMQSVDPGFDAAHLYAVQVRLPEDRYTTPAARATFVSRVTDGIRRLPGVMGVTVAAGAPTWRNFMIGALQLEGDPLPPAGTTDFIDYNAVEPGYFRFMGIPIVEGSTITDTTKAAAQVIVNVGFARKYWPGQSPLGKRLRVAYNGQGQWMTIVGVAANALTSGPLGDGSRPLLYTPPQDKQQPAILVRVTPGVDPMTALRGLVAEADVALPPPTITNVENALDRTVARPRFTMMLLVVFTGLALVLAAVGLYGVMAYTVTQQTREIGIRIALGAPRGSIARAVLSRGVIMAGAGAVVGVIGARWGSRLLASMLYGVQPTDAVSFTIGVLVLITTALVACLVPMRRAISVDPLVSIRAD